MGFAGHCLRAVRIGTVATMLGCTPAGYVLHVDNKESVPYDAIDERLKQRVLHALLRHRLVAYAQAATCGLNIMEIDRFYVVEVWPDGISSGNRYSIRLKKPFLLPTKKYADCPGAETDTCGRIGKGR